MMKFLKILIPINLDKCIYTYSFKDELEYMLTIGSYVRVQFGKKDVIGLVIEIENKKNFKQIRNIDFDISLIKEIKEILKITPMSKELIKLINWSSHYTMYPKGAVLKMAMPMIDYMIKEKTEIRYFLSEKFKNIDFNDEDIKLPEKQKLIINYLSQNTNCTFKNMLKDVDISKSTLNTLEKKGFVEKKDFVIKTLNKLKYIKVKKKIILDEQQKQASKKLRELINGEFEVALLDGVTGSGKTEVYLDLIEKVLEKNKQVLVILPEIALFEQWIERFKNRFYGDFYIWNSSVSKSKKQKTWHEIINGNAKIVIGARSSLFLPFKNLGLIVIDEEHDSSYKQEQGVVYNLRDMAIVRSKFNKSLCLLGTATPSIETWNNVKNKKFHHIRMANRYGNAKKIDIKLIDLKNEKLKSDKFISEKLLEKLKKNIEDKNQSLLFLNRKGYAPLIVCRSCGHRYSCKNCSSWLVYHKTVNKMVCHHCGYKKNYDKKCISCEKDNLYFCGPGIERLKEEVVEEFPNVNIFVATAETFLKKSEIKYFLENMKNGNIDIVIGTQIITKGHHFPKLTLVGVIDADMALVGGDLRAGEKTFQMLEQVSGRAGREKFLGKAYIQTASIDNEVFLCLSKNDRNAFLSLELENRKKYNQPPFVRFVSVILSSKNKNKIDNYGRNIVHLFPKLNDVYILGPVEPNLAFYKNLHRRRILIVSKKNIKIQEIIKNWMVSIKKDYQIKIKIDVDPYNFH